MNFKKEIASKIDKKWPKHYLEKEFERKRAYDIVLTMDEKQYSKEVCEWGAKGFASIASLAMTTQNAESLADFLDDGGCESLLNIMNKFGEESSLIAAFGCMTISILAYCLRELKEFLGEIGGCEVVVYVMSVHVGDPEVSEYGSHAIGILANNNISNSYRLSESNACDILAQVGNFGFNLRHEKCVPVAKNVCYAFAQLAEAVNAKRLMECGASCLVCHLTKLHFKNEEFAIAAVHAICALASLNPFHREELGKNGICKLIVDIIQVHHDNTPLITEGCESIMHLSLSPNNADKLSDHNACELIISLFSKVMMEIEFGTEICTGALLHFATYGNGAKKNRIKFVLNHTIDLLKTAQFSAKASFKARENINTLLELLNNEVSLNSELGNSIVNGGPGTQNNASSASSPNPSLPSSNSSVSIPNSTSSHLISVIHGSEMKGNTIPLHVEVREVIEYDSLHNKLNKRTESPPHDVIDPASSLNPSSSSHISPKNGLESIGGFGMKLLGMNKSRSNSSAVPMLSENQTKNGTTPTAVSGNKGIYEI